jgi:hypothetical protein
MGYVVVELLAFNDHVRFRKCWTVGYVGDAFLFSDDVAFCGLYVCEMEDLEYRRREWVGWLCSLDI